MGFNANASSIWLIAVAWKTGLKRILRLFLGLMEKIVVIRGVLGLEGDVAVFVSYICILTPKLGVSSCLFRGNLGLQRD